ncbi:MAG: DUF1080 domain-containing protein, partial [Planctomycetales bacterium]|nr:DUF1080 domain-containing protein [Planctomycetales bacterium]
MTTRTPFLSAALAVVIASLLLVSKPADAQSEDSTVRVQVDVDKTLHEISPNVYGHFLEHIYHSANGGLWGELVWNRSFELSNGGTGDWSVDDGEVVQSSLITDVHFLFGDPTWQDYEITLQARKVRGSEGFMIMFRATDDQNFYWLNLGGWSNSRHAIEKEFDNRRRAIGPDKDGSIEEDRWYDIRVRVEGDHFQCWLDGEQVIDMHDERDPLLAGGVGLATWGTHSRYRNIKVTSLDGSTELFSGAPEVPEKKEQIDFWTHVGEGSAHRVEDALNNRYSVELKSDGRQAGLLQENYKFEPQSYHGSLAMKATQDPIPDGVKVELLDGERVLGQAILDAPTAGWS